MKNIILIPVLFLLSIKYSYAQDLPAASGVSNNIIGHTAFVEAYDENGKPLTEVNKKVAGSPVLNENWGKGQVRFINDFLFQNMELQFDLYTNELHFRKDSIGYSFVDLIKEFSLEYTEEDKVKSATFRSGYPSIQKKTSTTFYKVLASGPNVHLLDYVSKQVRENYTYAGPLRIEYKTEDEYFLYDVKTGNIKNVNLSRSSLLKALPAYADAIKKIADDNNYNFKSENEVIKLFKALN
ncbi:MAG: hypothetical protein ABJA37_09870 [Ferruginibacter sp.]